jgi:hypothetical protein
MLTGERWDDTCAANMVDDAIKSCLVGTTTCRGGAGRSPGHLPTAVRRQSGRRDMPAIPLGVILLIAAATVILHADKPTRRRRPDRRQHRPACGPCRSGG